MNEITRVLSAAGQDVASASEDLLRLLYDDLRKVAAKKLAAEQPGQTLQATALVHEAYLRLVQGGEQHWDHRGHFFAAAAEAMRRILVERARRKQSLRHGGNRQREPLDGNEPVVDEAGEDLDMLALNEALERLEAVSPRRARLVKLRYFGGLTMPEAAEILDLSQSTAEADWTYAKAWLRRELDRN
ncbi:RNA polymerase subunit sigma [Planctomyces sp. SCGC AG-212-M04]|nr:RNA polymerase subunit sigma [Planctomyces sp. SCGC AG-212-M04]